MMKKRINNLTVSTLRVEEMFNVRGGNSSDKKEKDTSSKTNTTATSEVEDIIL